MMSKIELGEFSETIRGRVIGHEDDDYDQLRALYNGMIDKHPAVIVQCVDVADVQTALAWGLEKDLTIALRGGGHNGPGLGSVNDGLVIDLGPMKGIHVNPGARTVRVEPGCTQGDMDHATHAFGLHVPAGIVSTTGVAGLTLGGGHGYLTRAYGLTIDNLLEADLVLADGSFVTASESENEDLFWALRGGGGNFGIVTSFKFRLHPVKDVYAGPIFYDLEHTKEIMTWYRDSLDRTPRDLCTFLGIKTVPSTDPFPEEIWGRRICALISCFNGDQEEGERAVFPIRDELPEPIMDGMQQMPFTALQGLFDPLLPTGLQWYWKGDFVEELTDEAIDAHVEHGARSPTELSLMHLYPIDGAVQEKRTGDTAWSERHANWSMVIAGISPDPKDSDRITRWARDYWSAVHEFNPGGAYINFMMEEGDERIAATYGENYHRLVQVKRKYDPDNVFRVNQNIKP